MRLKVEIFMKSGNVVKVKPKKFNYTKTSGGDITELSWEGSNNNHFLKSINLD